MSAGQRELVPRPSIVEWSFLLVSYILKRYYMLAINYTSQTLTWNRVVSAQAGHSEQLEGSIEARGSNAITYARKHNRLYKTCTRVHSAQTGKAQASIHQIGTRTPSNTVRSREGHMRHAPSFTVPLATTRLATSFSSRDPASARPCPAHLPVAGCPSRKEIGLPSWARHASSGVSPAVAGRFKCIGPRSPAMGCRLVVCSALLATSSCAM